MLRCIKKMPSLFSGITNAKLLTWGAFGSSTPGVAWQAHSSFTLRTGVSDQDSWSVWGGAWSPQRAHMPPKRRYLETEKL